MRASADHAAAGLVPPRPRRLAVSEAACLPIAESCGSLRRTPRRYLQRLPTIFGWQLNYVLGSSSISRVQQPLVAVQLAIAKVGSSGGEVRREALELTPGDLDATLAALAAPTRSCAACHSLRSESERAAEHRHGRGRLAYVIYSLVPPRATRRPADRDPCLCGSLIGSCVRCPALVRTGRKT